MKVSDLMNKLKLELFAGQTGIENEINGGYVSDLLSDVIGNAERGKVWITLQTHRNIIAVASLKDLAAIIIVNNFEPAEDAIKQANIEGIPILGTKLGAFETSGKLYNLLKNNEQL